MANAVFVMSSGACKGIDKVAGALLKAVADRGGKVLPFRPLAVGKEDADVSTVADALDLVQSGRKKQLLDGIVKRFHEIAAECDVVVCLGSENAAAPSAFETELNFEVAASFDAALVFAIDASAGVPLPMQARSLAAMAASRGADVAAYFVCNGTCAMKCGKDCCADAPVFGSLVNEFTIDDAFVQCVLGRKGWRVTPAMFEYRMIEQARKHRMRIVLPEGTEPRILRAAEDLVRRGVVDIILLGDEAVVKGKIKDLGLDMGPVTIINPPASEKYESYAAAYAEYRKSKGVTIEQAREKMLDGSYYGSMMVKQGDADGMVSGSINTTAHTIRPAFEFIRTKPGFSSVSGIFLMCMKDRVLVFADCAVTPNPTTDQLAETAVASAETARLFGVEPRVAMLSYGTGNSGKGPSVDATVEATAKAREKAPGLAIEGPIQYDAAMAPEVAGTKLPDSPVAGRATVLIFPDLNAGNIGYKAVQRSANAIAIGPILQGLNKPVNDLSRGCNVADIINTVAITAIQAQAEKGLL